MNTMELIERIAIQGKIMFEDSTEPSNAALFEVLLFSSLKVLNTYEERSPQENHQDFMFEWFHGLMKWAMDNNVFDKIPAEFSSFVDSRFRLYSDEMQQAFNHANFLRSKTAYLFYENPLAIDVLCSTNTGQVSNMEVKTNDLLNNVGGSVGWLIRTGGLTLTIR
jgi:hypothetical protein